jgi:hypothetical protein
VRITLGIERVMRRLAELEGVDVVGDARQP